MCQNSGKTFEIKLWKNFVKSDFLCFLGKSSFVKGITIFKASFRYRMPFKPFTTTTTNICISLSMPTNYVISYDAIVVKNKLYYYYYYYYL